VTTDGRDAALDAQLQQAFAALRASSSPGHPTEDDWTRFAADEMSSDERTRIADHVVSCTECASIFRVLSLVGADAKATAPRRSALGDWRGLAAAAVLLLTIGVGSWWAFRRPVDDGLQRAGKEPAPAAVSALDAAPAPSASWASLPIAPEVRLPPDLILTMRGAEGDREGFLKSFGAAIAPYRAGRFAEAAAALTPVAERYADVAEVWFYLGTSRLYSGAAPEAIESLRRAQSSAVVGDDARWLEAVALQRAGREGEARASLASLCSAAGQYQQQACAVIKP
jgi:hypothetical protein